MDASTLSAPICHESNFKTEENITQHTLEPGSDNVVVWPGDCWRTLAYECGEGHAQK